MTQIDDWVLEFAIEFNSIVSQYIDNDSLPLVCAGTSPVADINRVVKQARPQVSWFYYEWTDMPREYWELVALHYRTRSDVRINLSDSHELSLRVGIPVASRNVPDLWIMTVEPLTLHK
jgi:hypothetical protein